MTREEAVKEIKKAFEPAFANYIIIALTEGATVSDIQHRWGRAYEAGVKDGLEQEPSRDMEEIREIMECDADAETKCKMISNILTAKPHYFEKQESFKPMVEIDLDYVIKQKYVEREALDKIRAEIEKQEKWLLHAGYNTYNVDIAFNSIKLALAELGTFASRIDDLISNLISEQED